MAEYRATQDDVTIDSRQGGTDIELGYNSIRVNNTRYLQKRYKAGEIFENKDFYGFVPRQNCSWLAPYVVDANTKQLHQLSAQVYADVYEMALYYVDPDTYFAYKKLEGALFVGKTPTTDEEVERITSDLGLEAVFTNKSDLREKVLRQVMHYPLLLDLRYMTPGKIVFTNNIASLQAHGFKVLRHHYRDVWITSLGQSILRRFTDDKHKRPTLVAYDEKGSYSADLYSPLPDNAEEGEQNYIVMIPTNDQIMRWKKSMGITAATMTPVVMPANIKDFLQKVAGYDIFIENEQILDGMPIYNNQENTWSLTQGLTPKDANLAIKYKYMGIIPPVAAIDMKTEQVPYNDGAPVRLFIKSDLSPNQLKEEEGLYFTGRFMYTTERHLFAEAHVSMTEEYNPFCVKGEDVNIKLRDDLNVNPNHSVRNEDEDFLRAQQIRDIYIPDGQIPDTIWLRCSTNMGCYGFYDALKKQWNIVPCGHKHKNWIISKIFLVYGDDDTLDYLTNYTPEQAAKKEQEKQKKRLFPALLFGAALLND